MCTVEADPGKNHRAACETELSPRLALNFRGLDRQGPDSKERKG
jgi:hypothetical protein